VELLDCVAEEISIDFKNDETLLLIINIKWDDEKGIESKDKLKNLRNGYPIAVGTFESGLELAEHQISDDGGVGFVLKLPLLLGDGEIWPSVTLYPLVILFLLNSIQVLIETIEQKCNEF
jgi:hypothetical protein